MTDSVQFDGNNVVLVSFPKEPEKLVWVQRGPTGEIPEQMLNDAVDHLIAESTDARDSAEGFASHAQTSADSAAAYASQASDAAFDADNSATESASSASDANAAKAAAQSAQASAEGSATAAQASAVQAQTWAESFDVNVGTTTTGDTGSNASVTVTGDGPSYELSFTIPRGDKGAQGDPGEVSQAQLDAAVASLVSGSPDALNTLDELAAALGDDPNFATTVSTEIGLRAKTSDVNTALAGKANSTHTHPISQVVDLQGVLDNKADQVATALALSQKAAASHTHTKSEVGLGNVDNTSDASKPISTSTQAALDNKADASQLGGKTLAVVTELPASPDANTIYFVKE